MLTHSIASGTFPATVPIVIPQPKRTPDAILAEIQAELRRSNDDADRDAELFCLGIDVLKRRQSQRQGGGR